MIISHQIEVVKNLLAAAKELNGEYQDGWDEEIQEGEEFLKYLNAPKTPIETKVLIEFKRIQESYNRFKSVNNTVMMDIAAAQMNVLRDLFEDVIEF